MTSAETPEELTKADKNYIEYLAQQIEHDHASVYHGAKHAAETTIWRELSKRASLEKENAELKARLTTVQDLLDASLVDYETHTETIKRYKALIEEHIELDGWIYQKNFEHDMPGATPLHEWILKAKSAISGTNE